MMVTMIRRLALICAFGLAAVACGGADSTASDAPSADADADPQTTQASDAGTASGDGGSSDGSDGATDAGGRSEQGDGGDAAPIDRTGEVIRVGYVNNEGGNISLPELRIGGEVAIGVINDAGGIHGATIEPIVCLSDGTPESAINCAVKLIEEDVVMAYMGVELGSEAAIHLWLDAGIPYVSSHSWGPTERVSDGAFLLHVANGAFAVGPAKTFAELGVDHIAVVVQDSPNALDFLDNIIVKVLAHHGIEMERIVVDIAAPDWTAAVAAAQSAGVDGMMGQLDEFACIGMVGSAAASGFDKPIFAGSCSLYIGVLGDAAVGTYTQGDQWGPLGGRVRAPQVPRAHRRLHRAHDGGRPRAAGGGLRRGAVRGLARDRVRPRDDHRADHRRVGHRGIRERQRQPRLVRPPTCDAARRRGPRSRRTACRRSWCGRW